MDTSRFIMLEKTHFDFLLGFMHGFLCRNMFPVVHSFWVFLSRFIVHVFGSIIVYFFRFPADRYLQKIDSGNSLDSNFDHVDQGNRGGENSSMVASTSKYEFLYRNGISGCIEEPKAASYTVHELYTDSNDYNNGGTIDSSVSADGDVGKIQVEKVENPIESFKETDAVFEDKTEQSALRFSFSIGFEKQIKQEQSVEANVNFEQKTENFDEQKLDDSVENFIVEKLLEKPKQENETEDIFGEKAEESLENYTTENILQKHVSDHVKEKFWEFLERPVIDKYIGKWQREKDELTPKNHPPSDGQKVEIMEQEIHEQKTSFSDQDGAISRGPIDYSDDEFIELEPRSEKFSVTGETQAADDLSFEDEDGEEERTLQEEEEDDQEFGSEHDDLMERLKMELKMARTGGLPTILEESESPKMMQELGPLQIGEKFDHKDHVAEIQKVYKSYSDKMRKLDILNSQTMHAISLLQLKGLVQPSTSEKSSAPAMKSLLSSFKQRKPEADPAMKLVSDLYKEFETVYVGQVCLSWEILHWQFGKVKQLFECDRHGVRQYNQVAGEFQRFQVLVQRFLEDEPFQVRPRVENYVKNRCALRNFLQVPVIKDDCSKYKNGAGHEENAVSSEMLTDIIEESMHVLWEFLHADKDEANATSKVPQQAQVAPLDPIDLDLLKEVRTGLQKKEKRLKEIQRSTNCIIKKFRRQQHQGNLLDHALFIAQVELQLVSRVLKMVKITTDQTVWCHEKLQKINFSSRKIEIEPSFSLFPC